MKSKTVLTFDNFNVLFFFAMALGFVLTFKYLGVWAALGFSNGTALYLLTKELLSIKFMR